ncbi:MAG: hypothetical protein EBS06_01045 [Proteobacteria bacterium]|nr:hypothetical protein [Pseudomonadota bacterium]
MGSGSDKLKGFAEKEFSPRAFLKEVAHGEIMGIKAHNAKGFLQHYEIQKVKESTNKKDVYSVTLEHNHFHDHHTKSKLVEVKFEFYERTESEYLKNKDVKRLFIQDGPRQEIQSFEFLESSSNLKPLPKHKNGPTDYSQCKSTPKNNSTWLWSVANAITLGLPLVPLLLEQSASVSNYFYQKTENQFLGSLTQNLYEISSSGLESWSLFKEDLKENAAKLRARSEAIKLQQQNRPCEKVPSDSHTFKTLLQIINEREVEDQKEEQKVREQKVKEQKKELTKKPEINNKPKNSFKPYEEFCSLMTVRVRKR